jgi:hypothetical protein
MQPIGLVPTRLASLLEHILESRHVKLRKRTKSGPFWGVERALERLLEVCHYLVIRRLWGGGFPLGHKHLLCLNGGVRGPRGTLLPPDACYGRWWPMTESDGFDIGWRLEDRSPQQGEDAPGKLLGEGRRRSQHRRRWPIITIHLRSLSIREAELNHPWWRTGVCQQCLCFSLRGSVPSSVCGSRVDAGGFLTQYKENAERVICRPLNLN